MEGHLPDMFIEHTIPEIKKHPQNRKYEYGTHFQDKASCTPPAKVMPITQPVVEEVIPQPQYNKHEQGPANNCT
jgi:hypothetical protein